MNNKYSKTTLNEKSMLFEKLRLANQMVSEKILHQMIDAILNKDTMPVDAKIELIKMINNEVSLTLECLVESYEHGNINNNDYYTIFEAFV